LIFCPNAGNWCDDYKMDEMGWLICVCSHTSSAAKPRCSSCNREIEGEVYPGNVCFSKTRPYKHGKKI